MQLQETRLDVFFPTAQFEIKGHYSPIRLVLPIKVEAIPSRKLSCDDVCNSIQAIPFEINLRKEKWLVISIYLPPLQDCFLSKFFNKDY